MTQPLAIHAAAHNVELYERHAEKNIADHHEAMDCLDCQAFLQLGIDAFKWLVDTDFMISKAVASGVTEYDSELESQLDDLFRRWLGPSEFANSWIDVQLQRGYQPDNLRRYRKCQREIQSIVKLFDQSAEQMSDAMVVLRNRAIEEHRRGETAEFI